MSTLKSMNCVNCAAPLWLKNGAGLCDYCHTVYGEPPLLAPGILVINGMTHEQIQKVMDSWRQNLETGADDLLVLYG